MIQPGSGLFASCGLAGAQRQLGSPHGIAAHLKGQPCPDEVRAFIPSEEFARNGTTNNFANDILTGSAALLAKEYKAGRLDSINLEALMVYLVDIVDSSALPWLGEQFSLFGDGWELAESDDVRRTLIKSAIELHRYKGTPWAIKQALKKLGLERFTLIEHPEAAHWAEFDVDITVVDRPLTEAIYPQITQLIDTYKPARSHLRRLIVSVASRGAFNAACVSFAGDIVTVQPYQLTDITAPSMQPKAGIGRHDWGTTTIYPRTL